MAAKRKAGKKGNGKQAPVRRADKENGGLSARPMWQGHLRLSLVSCPVLLYNATRRAKDISFHFINPETNNRIRMVPTDPETGPIPRAELVRGYPIDKERYVILSDEELDAVKLETTHTLDIERFVDAETIDRLYWNDPYFLLPDGEMGADAYVVIREAMEGAGRIALGRLVMHTRERLMALEPQGKGIVAYTLRMRDEVLSAEKAFRDIPDVKPDKRMIEIAEKIITQQEGPFAPAEFRDRYEEALRDLIRRKEKGEATTVAPAPPEDTNVIDLMDALRRSLKDKGSPARARKAAAIAKHQRKHAR